ncbi:MAG TPA: DUF5367 family protein [Terriglobia bacterium]
MNRTLLLYGLGLWFMGTVLLRVAGQHLLHPGSLAATLPLYFISVLAMAWLARRLCLRLGLPREQWPAGAASLALPTLILDPFSSAYFPAVFPNIEPGAAGVFGGWMLCCCAGALLGATIGARARR